MLSKQRHLEKRFLPTTEEERRFLPFRKKMHDIIGEAFLAASDFSTGRKLGSGAFGDVREAVVSWLAASVNRNAGRGKMQITPLACASHGGACNLSAVALRLCMPFIDPNTRKFLKIDPNYPRSQRCRLDLNEVTRLAATADETASEALPESEEPAEGYGFICECFFLASRLNHLGFIKCAAEHTQLARELRRARRR